MYKFSNVIILFLLLTSFAYAERVEGPSPTKPGDIFIEIVASGTPEYIDTWLNTAPSEAVTIQRLKEAKPNQLIVISFLVSGMSANNQNNYSFTVSMYIEYPNGKLLFGKQGYAKGKGKHFLVPSFVMADPALDLYLEPSDPEGIYKVFAQVKDLVSNKTYKNTYEIKFTK